MNIAARNKDIAQRYIRGDKVKDIFSLYPGIPMKEFYGALREHGVPKRGRGSYLRDQWAQARATGQLPPTLQKCYNGRREVEIKKAKKSTNKKPTTNDTAHRQQPKRVGSTPGEKTLSVLLSTGAITEADIEYMASVINSPLTVSSTGSVDKVSRHDPGYDDEYKLVVRHHKKKRLTQREIAKVVGVSLSTVRRYIEEYRTYG